MKTATHSCAHLSDHLLRKDSTDIGWFPHIASSLGLIKPLAGETEILSEAITTLVVVSKGKLREDVARLSERLKGTNRIVFSPHASHRVVALGTTPKRAQKLIGDWLGVMIALVALSYVQIEKTIHTDCSKPAQDHSEMQALPILLSGRSRKIAKLSR